MIKIFGINIGLKCICYSNSNFPKTTDVVKKPKTFNINRCLRKSEVVKNIHQPLSYSIKDLSKSLQSNRIRKLSKKNKTRLDNIIVYMQNRFGENRTREYILMRELLVSRKDLNLIAIEYEFDEGGCGVQQHGDMILLDENNNILITECKCIDLDKPYAANRQQMVKDQALRCCARFTSWINHISQFDKTKKNVSDLKIIPCTLTTFGFDRLAL